MTFRSQEDRYEDCLFEEELCGGRRKQRKSGQNNPED